MALSTIRLLAKTQKYIYLDTKVLMVPTWINQDTINLLKSTYKEVMLAYPFTAWKMSIAIQNGIKGDELLKVLEDAIIKHNKTTAIQNVITGSILAGLSAGVISLFANTDKPLAEVKPISMTKSGEITVVDINDVQGHLVDTPVKIPKEETKGLTVAVLILVSVIGIIFVISR